MTIPSVVQGTVEFAGKVFQVNSPRGLTWLESVTSFRYVPTGIDKPFTVRKEAGKGGDYWYGYRKMSGRLHKKYIGKSSELSTAKLEEIAEALNTPPQSRVIDKVTQVTETSDSIVTDKVTDTRNSDRLTALELQVQTLQESLETLRSELLGKLESGNSEELPTVTDDELQNELGNLSAENEVLREEVARLRLQLDQERATGKEIEAELADLKQNSASASKDLPEAATILKDLRKVLGKKSTASLADVEKILEILEEQQ